MVGEVDDGREKCAGERGYTQLMEEAYGGNKGADERGCEYSI